MPLFRFRRNRIPRTIEYRDAIVTLEIVQQPTALADWVLQARKIGDKRGEPCMIYRLCLSREIFDHRLFQEGFEVDRGSPAEKIMRRLVRDGHAEQSLGR